MSGLSGEAFRLSGLKAFTDMWDPISRYAPDPGRARVLDWGCGCGRIARYLTRGGIGEVLGCDLDAEAIDWCAENLDGQYSHVTPDPPLPYGDGGWMWSSPRPSSPIWIGARQADWLREIHRVLSVGGLLIASVHGMDATRLGQKYHLPLGASPGSLLDRTEAFLRAKRLQRAGIIDRQIDTDLDGIAPAGYYRAVYQARDHTLRAWGSEFDILEYVERGLTGHQDLVVLRSSSD